MDFGFAISNSTINFQNNFQKRVLGASIKGLRKNFYLTIATDRIPSINTVKIQALYIYITAIHKLVFHKNSNGDILEFLTAHQMVR